MLITEKQKISPNDPRHSQCLELCRLSNNLYNASLYDIRQHFFNTGEYKNFYVQRPEFSGVNPDYTALPAKVSGVILQEVHKNFKSFFTLLKKKNNSSYNKKVSIPKYKKSGGLKTITFPKDTISKKHSKNGNIYTHIVCPKDLSLSFKSKIKNITMVRIVPKSGYFSLQVVYEVNDIPSLPDNGNYAAIDFGINNIVSLVFNNGDLPLLYNGKPVKSINRYYNKKKASIQSSLGKGVFNCKRLERLTTKRNNKIDWFFHNLSSNIVNQLVSKNVNTLIVGYNKEWKQDINTGRVNNQRFVSIPYYKLVKQLEYKCALRGINMILTEESYTSKASFIDKDIIPVYGVNNSVFSGRRIKRGSYKSKNNIIINADVNGAFNIMRKVIPDLYVYKNGVLDNAVYPCRVNIYSTKSYSSS